MTTRPTNTNARNQVAADDACPHCGERNADRLTWQPDGKTVVCHDCVTEYTPGQRPTPTADACNRVHAIAQAQTQIRELMERTAAEWNRLQIAMSQNAAAIRTLVTKGADANAVVEAIRRERVNTGDLNSRMVDLLEEKAGTKFTRDGCIRTNWVVIENRF